MGEEIVIINVFKSLKKRLNLILSITILSIATVWVLLEFIVTPDFQASTQIWVEGLVDETPEGDSAEVQLDPMMTDAYSDLLKSQDVLERVQEELELDYSVRDLQEQITVIPAINPQILNITVNTSEKKEAVEIANTLTIEFQEALIEWLDTDNVTVITAASEEATLSSLDNEIFDLALAGVFGLIVGTLIAVILEILNIAFKNNKGMRRKRKKEETKLQTVFK